MKVYTYTEARQRLAEVLDLAEEYGEVRIRRRNGRVYAVRPVVEGDSPLDVGWVDLDLTAEEIVAFVREGRERG